MISQDGVMFVPKYLSYEIISNHWLAHPKLQSRDYTKISLYL